MNTGGELTLVLDVWAVLGVVLGQGRDTRYLASNGILPEETRLAESSRGRLRYLGSPGPSRRLYNSRISVDSKILLQPYPYSLSPASP